MIQLNLMIYSIPFLEYKPPLHCLKREICMCHRVAGGYQPPQLAVILLVKVLRKERLLLAPLCKDPFCKSMWGF